MDDEEVWTIVHEKMREVAARMGVPLTGLGLAEVCKRLSQGYYENLVLTREERAVVKGWGKSYER